MMAANDTLDRVLAHSNATVQGPLALVRHVQRILNQSGFPRTHNASSVVSSISAYNRSELIGDTGAAGLTWNDAAMGAVGECIERYCCAVYDHEELVHATQRQLGAAAIGMERFAIYSQRQQSHPDYPFAAASPDLPIHWVGAKVLGSGEARYVPACLSFIPYVAHTGAARPNDLLAYSVSSGQACHTDPDAAMLSGLCEVVERDAFIITWLKQLEAPRLEWRHDAQLAALYERHFKCRGIEFHLFDLTLDIGIPTVLCIAEGTSARGPYLCVGASTRPNYRQAVIKAWLEASQTLTWANSLMQRRADWRPDPDFMNVRDFEDHVRLYCEPEMRAHAGFLLDTALSVAPDFDAGCHGSAAQDLAACVRAVEAAGYEACAVDLTTSEIRDLGFVVPKVFIPGLATLYATHGLPTLGCPRLEQVPRKLSRKALPEGAFNSIPHPFP